MKDDGRRPLKVGVQLPEVERAVRWSEIRDMARAAEDSGVDSLWVGDHLLYRTPERGAIGPWEAWSVLAALAALTERVELGPLVACTSFHAPAMLAKKAATLDEISGGRLILGLGAGWNEVEYRGFGFAWDHRVSRFEEAFTIIRTLLAEGEIDFAGRYYQARGCALRPRGPRAAGPPLMIGSQGPRMLAATVPHVQAWNAWYSWFGNSPAGFARCSRKVDEACRRAGRDPASVSRSAALLVRFPSGEGRPVGDLERGEVVPAPLPSEPGPLAASLRAFAEAGADHVQLVLDPIDRASIEGLAPALARLDRGD